MGKRRFIPFLILGVGVVVALAIQTQEPIRLSESSYEALITLPNASVVYVDVADSEKERVQGLSGRTSLGTFEGMLFLYEDLVTPNYWMPDMHFPIDLIWMVDGQILGFSEQAEPEDPPVTYYTPEKPINQVLEVNAGFVQENQLVVGEILDIELLLE
jgi:uncharacterized membrane protein (UPF0127 family)